MKKYGILSTIILVISLILLILWLDLFYALQKFESEIVYPEIEFIDFRDYTIEEFVSTAEPPVKEMNVLIHPHIDLRTGSKCGPNGKETYYNLPMTRVVETMRKKGFSEEDYPYIERADGVKCLGEYAIVAASLEKYKRGDIVDTSVGKGIVCDTGEFAMNNPDQIDIAVTW